MSGRDVNAMSIERWRRASPHLDRLLDLPPTDCEAYLGSLGADDPDAAADVRALLAEHRLLTAEGFLASPAIIHRSEPALAGVAVGPYTLVSPIGHGGMGSVWLAERSDGRFSGHAAVKLLNAALVGRSAEKRFKREGTILARLTHPNIGRLIDAGVSGTGQPYLVLEHIDGRPIDRYCDDERLGIEDRIRLFLDVQAAVAHAHASLIVHRDLKPSNVLVTADGQAKLLDFGIAKLIDADGADAAVTMLTRDGDVALTPKYAAPEQVLGGPITTATDVYALGVILFELLCGQHPTGGDARVPAEFVKAVTDREPLRLTAALDAAANRAVIASHRSTTPDRLRRALQGDLETILARALKTNAAERYSSVAAFADDLRRHLADLPIAARDDAFGYRAAKFVRRNARVLGIAATVALLVASLIVFYTARLSKERDRAQLEAVRSGKVSEMLIGLLTSADPYRTPDATESHDGTPLEIAAQRIDKEMAGEPELQARILTMIGRTYERMGLHAKALPVLERALAIGRTTAGRGTVTLAQSLNDLGVLYREQGDLGRAEPLLRESLALRRQLLGPVDKDVAVTLIELARVLSDTGRGQEAEPAIRESLAIRRQVFGEEHNETAVSKSDLGRLLMRRGDLAGAEPYLRENVATTVHILGPDHPNSAAAKRALAQLLLAKGDMRGAEALLHDAADVDRRVFGANGLEYAESLNTMGIASEWQGRLAEAQDLYEQSLRIAQPQLGDGHPRVHTFAINLTRVRIARGDSAGTEPLLRGILAAREKLYPVGDWRIAQVQSLLAASLLADKRYEEAERLMLAADEALKPVAGMQARERVANHARLATLRRSAGRPQPPASR